MGGPRAALQCSASREGSDPFGGLGLSGNGRVSSTSLFTPGSGPVAGKEGLRTACDSPGEAFTLLNSPEGLQIPSPGNDWRGFSSIFKTCVRYAGQRENRGQTAPSRWDFHDEIQKTKTLWLNTEDR